MEQAPKNPESIESMTNDAMNYLKADSDFMGQISSGFEKINTFVYSPEGKEYLNRFDYNESPALGDLLKRLKFLAERARIMKDSGNKKIYDKSITEAKEILEAASIRITNEFTKKDNNQEDFSLSKEDQELFNSLCEMIGLRKFGPNDNKYWRIHDCFRDSHRVDVSHDIFRYLGSELRANANSEVMKIINFLLKRGYEAQAVKWLTSRSVEGMKSGNGSKELRLEKAREMATQAGRTIEDIAKSYELEYLLH